MISGAMDALLGVFFLLAGLGFLPVDLAQFGMQDWHAMLVSGIFSVLGLMVLFYNLSRLEE